MFVLLCLNFPSLRAEAPDHLVVPVTLTASTGQVSLVEDFLWLKYPYENLTAIPPKLSELVDQLSTVLNDLEQESPYPDRVKRLLIDRLLFVKENVFNALNIYDTLQSAQCSKRGLVDGIGKIAKMLFGTAFDAGVKHTRGLQSAGTEVHLRRTIRGTPSGP